MLFASFDFLLFFPVAFAGFWALSSHPRWRAAFVVAASYFFYMAGSKPVDGPPPTRWYFVGLLVASTVVDYVLGLLIARARERAQLRTADTSARTTARAGRGWLALSVLANLGLLGYFKYTGFLLEAAGDIARALGAAPALPVFSVLLPVGISFYTFQSMSYTIDVYRGRLPAERNPLRFAFFVAFFPQLVAGPIVRATEFLPQIKDRPRLSRDDVDHAVYRISKGLVKKVVFGDFIAASFTDLVFASPAEHSSLENLLALYAFTLQIYADFSGYSDIAIGTARLFGFRIPENFNRPYQAVDIADFWRRWHITLSTWLRDYLYYPLGGSRLGLGRTYLNLFVTMFLVGIWHGASWNFVVYALLQASAMVYNRYVTRQAGSGARRVLRLLAPSLLLGCCAFVLARYGLGVSAPWKLGVFAGLTALGVGLLPSVERVPALTPLHVFLTVHFSVLSRVFFRSDTLESAGAMSEKLAGWDGLGVRPGLFRVQELARWIDGIPALGFARPLAEWGLLILLGLGFLLHYTPAFAVHREGERLVRRIPAAVVGLGLAALFGFMSLLLAGPRANIYFAF